LNAAYSLEEFFSFTNILVEMRTISETKSKISTKKRKECIQESYDSVVAETLCLACDA